MLTVFQTISQMGTIIFMIVVDAKANLKFLFFLGHIQFIFLSSSVNGLMSQSAFVAPYNIARVSKWHDRFHGVALQHHSKVWQSSTMNQVAQSYLVERFLSQGYRYERLRNSFKTFYGRY